MISTECSVEHHWGSLSSAIFCTSGISQHRSICVPREFSKTLPKISLNCWCAAGRIHLFHVHFLAVPQGRKPHTFSGKISFNFSISTLVFSTCSARSVGCLCMSKAFTLMCICVTCCPCLFSAVEGMDWPTKSEAVWGIWKSSSLGIWAVGGLPCVEWQIVLRGVHRWANMILSLEDLT